MENITVRRYKIEDYHLWNNFVFTAKNATFLFHRDFMEYHKDRFEDYSLVFEKKGRIIAVLPAHLVDKQLASYAGLTYGGLLVGNELRIQDFIFLCKKMFSFLNKQGIETMLWKEIPSFYTLQGNDEWKYVLFLMNATLVRRDLCSVLSLKKEARWSKSIKRDANLGKRQGFEIVKSTNYTFFWEQILEPTLYEIHHAKPVHTLEEIVLLANSFPENIQLFCLKLNDEIIAGTVLFINNDVVHVQYISALRSYRKLGALDYLFYYLIKEEFSEFRYFDFGTSHEQGGLKINAGLMFWKESFGARSVAQDYYEIKVDNVAALENIFV